MEQSEELTTGAKGWLANLLTPAELQPTNWGKAVRAQLLILDGQYLLHYPTFPDTAPGEARSHYKFISPAAVQQAFSQIPLDSDWLYPGVVRCGWERGGEAWAALFIEAGCHNLRLKLPPPVPRAKRRLARFGATGEMVLVEQVALPPLLLVGRGRDYRLFALGTTVSFNPKATLYLAPLPNVYPDGRICWGNIQPPLAQPTATGIGQAWQQFIGSDFTDHLANHKSLIYSQDVRYSLLLQVAAYPLTDLVKYRRNSFSQEEVTATDFINQMLAQEQNPR